LSEKTLVVFTSDNGGVMDDGYEDVGRFDYHPNAPLKGFKGSLWEGGHRVPFIARWPGRIPAGSVSDALMAHLDMAASFAAILGVSLPGGEFRDSFNVSPAWLGRRESAPLRPHFVAHIGGTQGPFSLQVGDWKYVETTPPVRSADSRRKEASPPAAGAGGRVPGLYNLAKDLAENHNLAQAEPEKLQEMKNLLQKLRQSESGVEPANRDRGKF
jgi:arylsulfatase A-like enzyme